MKARSPRGRTAAWAVIGIVLIVGLASFLYFRTAGAAGVGEVRFSVEKGSSAYEIAEALEKAGLVRNARVFRVVARIRGADSKFQAGYYSFATNATMGSIIETLAEGRQSLEKVTAPEGYTARMTAKLFEDKGICTAADFLQAVNNRDLAEELGIPAHSIEGYLYPDTYLVSPGMTGGEIVRLMVAAFRERVAGLPGLAEKSPKMLHEAVILASIVEREYRVASEAPMIASVFLNRLSIGMGLQSCATVVYILTEKQGKPHPEVVKLSDLKIKDPYNTYLYRDLPPGPISNPGLVALSAVSDPAKSEYLYFRLADAEKGIHRFSRTLEEHDQNSLPVKGF